MSFFGCETVEIDDMNTKCVTLGCNNGILFTLIDYINAFLSFATGDMIGEN